MLFKFPALNCAYAAVSEYLSEEHLFGCTTEQCSFYKLQLMSLHLLILSNALALTTPNIGHRLGIHQPMYTLFSHRPPCESENKCCKTRICCRLLPEGEDIKAPFHWRSPEDKHRLLIQAPGLEKVESKIKDLEQEFSDYKIFVSSLEPHSTTDFGYPVYSVPLLNSDNVSMPFYLNADFLQRNPERQGLHGQQQYLSTVSVFLRDDDLQDRRRIFATTAAHAILTEGEQKQLEHYFAEPGVMKQLTHGVCKEAMGRCNLDECLSIALHDSETQVFLQDFPFVSYFNYIPADSQSANSLLPYQKFGSDIALLPVDPDKVQQRQELSQPPINTRVDGFAMKDVAKRRIHTRITAYLNIKEASDIDVLRNKGVAITVASTCGRLVEPPQTFTEDTSTLQTLSGPPSSQSQRGESHRSHRSENWKLSHFIYFTTERR